MYKAIFKNSTYNCINFKNITQSVTQQSYNFPTKRFQQKSLLMINILILEDDPIISLDIKAIIDDMDGFNSFIASNITDA